MYGAGQGGRSVGRRRSRAEYVRRVFRSGGGHAAFVRRIDRRQGVQRLCCAVGDRAGQCEEHRRRSFRRQRIDRGVARRYDARCEGVPRLSGAGCGRTRFDRHRSRRELQGVHVADIADGSRFGDRRRCGCVRGLFEARRPFAGQRRDDRRRQGVRRLRPDGAGAARQCDGARQRGLCG